MLVAMWKGLLRKGRPLRLSREWGEGGGGRQECVPAEAPVSGLKDSSCRRRGKGRERGKAMAMSEEWVS